MRHEIHILNRQEIETVRRLRPWSRRPRRTASSASPAAGTIGLICAACGGPAVSYASSSMRTLSRPRRPGASGGSCAPRARRHRPTWSTAARGRSVRPQSPAGWRSSGVTALPRWSASSRTARRAETSTTLSAGPTPRRSRMKRSRMKRSPPVRAEGGWGAGRPQETVPFAGAYSAGSPSRRRVSAS